MGESYNRAYGVMVSIQLLSELEETVQCLMMPERKPQLQETWWNRLLVCGEGGKGGGGRKEGRKGGRVRGRKERMGGSEGEWREGERVEGRGRSVYVGAAAGHVTVSMLQGCQRNVEDWQRILQVRSLVLSQQVRVYRVVYTTVRIHIIY